MNLIDFAPMEDFVAKLQEFVDFDALRALDADQTQKASDLTQFFSDWLLLKLESMGKVKYYGGRPSLIYNGPFIPNVLTRGDGEEADFSYLETLGMEEVGEVGSENIH